MRCTMILMLAACGGTPTGGEAEEDGEVTLGAAESGPRGWSEGETGDALPWEWVPACEFSEMPAGCWTDGLRLHPDGGTYRLVLCDESVMACGYCRNRPGADVAACGGFEDVRRIEGFCHVCEGDCAYGIFNCAVQATCTDDVADCP